MTSIPLAMRSIVTLLVTAGMILGQTGGGATLVGTVKDTSGSIVPGAKVRVVNTATNFVTEVDSSSDGAYYVPYLTPGDYQITVISPGFKETVREGISLRSAEVPRVDIVLEVGSLNEKVTVNASALMLNTEN